MTHQRISDTSTDEIEQALALYRSRKLALKEIACKWCGDIFLQKRHWQAFCSPGHQVAWHRDAEKLYIEKLEGRLAQLERDKSELQLLLNQARKEKPPVQTG